VIAKVVILIKFIIGNPWSLNQTAISDARHHRHWQRVLTQVAGLQLGSLRFSIINLISITTFAITINK